jgi:hypothetical protein
MVVRVVSNNPEPKKWICLINSETDSDHKPAHEESMYENYIEKSQEST